MKKLLSLFALFGLLAFGAAPIYAQEEDVVLDDEQGIVVESDDFDTIADDFNNQIDESVEDIVAEVTDVEQAVEDTVEGVAGDIENFPSIFEDEEIQNILGGLDLSNEDAAWFAGLFAWLGEWLLITLGIIGLILRILRIIALWKAFERAWEWWWKSLIPVYCSYIKYKLAGMKNWFWYALLIALIMWVVAACIPDQKESISDIATLITWIIYIVMTFKFARKYGWNTFASILFVLFYPICILILGFGNYKYQGKSEEIAGVA